MDEKLIYGTVSGVFGGLITSAITHVFGSRRAIKEYKRKKLEDLMNALLELTLHMIDIYELNLGVVTGKQKFADTGLLREASLALLFKRGYPQNTMWTLTELYFPTFKEDVKTLTKAISAMGDAGHDFLGANGDEAKKYEFMNKVNKASSDYTAVETSFKIKLSKMAKKLL